MEHLNVVSVYNFIVATLDVTILITVSNLKVSTIKHVQIVEKNVEYFLGLYDSVSFLYCAHSIHERS